MRLPDNDGCDVVVVGYGSAGAVAALEAADHGLKVVVVEKSPWPGGISILSSGGVRVGFDADKIHAYLRETCGGRTDDEVLRALAQGMTELPEYLTRLAEACGAETSVVPAKGNYPFPGSDALGLLSVTNVPNFNSKTIYPHVKPGRPGCLLFKVLEDNIKTRNIPVLLSTKGERLLRNAEGGISGVRVSDEHGVIRDIQSRAGVILACGGFESDCEMKSQFFSSRPVLSGSYRWNTGDGIRMAQMVGAGLWHMWHYHGPYGFRHPDPNYPFGIYTKLLPAWIPGEERKKKLPVMAWILVDQYGNRYVNEYQPYLSDTGIRQFDYFDPQQYCHPRTPSYLIFDENGRKLYAMGRSITNDGEFSYEWSADNLKEVKNGLLKKADTVEELAAILGIDPTALRNSIDKWNLQCRSGLDSDFGRMPETMMPVSAAPFYAGEVWPVAINTHGGPKHNAAQQVLDAFDEPINGLYAAGELGGVFGHIYLAGGNLAECFVGGRNAARHAASVLGA